jgi:hypothetical protein
MVCCISGVDVIGTFGVRRYYREIRYNLAAGVEENDAGGIRFLVNLENFVERSLGRQRQPIEIISSAMLGPI